LKKVFCILFLLTQLAANAQFKLGTFGVGANLGINYSRTGNNYYNIVQLGISANGFFSPKSEVRIGITNSNYGSNTKNFAYENYGYFMNYNYYLPLNSKAGFYSQTSLNYFYKPFYKGEKSETEIKNFFIQNSIGFYVLFFKGLAINAQYTFAGYINNSTTVKTANSLKNETNSGFSIDINPLYNLNAFQIGLNYYFNTKN
jgi:hypothetical protein